MLDAAQKLTDRDATPPVYGFAVRGEVLALAHMLLAQEQVPLFRGSAEQAEPNYTDPAVLQTLARYTELLTTSPHRALPGYKPGAAIDEADLLIQAGQVAMWIESEAAQQSPPGEIGMAPLPVQPGMVPPICVSPVASTSQRVQNTHKHAGIF